jgi:hypothetical protein
LRDEVADAVAELEDNSRQRHQARDEQADRVGAGHEVVKPLGYREPPNGSDLGFRLHELHLLQYDEGRFPHVGDVFK